MKKGKINIDWSGGIATVFNWSQNFPQDISKQGTFASGAFNYLGVGAAFSSSISFSKMGTITPVTQEDASFNLPASAEAINFTSSSATSNRTINTILTSGQIVEFIGYYAGQNFPPTNVTRAAPASFSTAYDIWTHVEYNAGAPREVAFFTYETFSTAYLGWKILDSNTRNDTFQILGGAGFLTFPKVGCVSVGNKTYITNRNYIATYNPDTGSFNAQSINLGFGYIAKSVVDYGAYVAIVGDNGNQARLWLWDGVSASFNFQYELRDTRAVSVTNLNGILKIFTSGNGNFARTKIKSFSGSDNFGVSDWESPTILAPNRHSAVCNWRGMMMWKTSLGAIFIYGSPIPNEYPNAVFQIGQLSNAIQYANSSGIKNVDGDDVLMGHLTGASTYQVVRYNNGVSSGIISFASMVYTLPHRSTITKMHIYFSNFNQINANEIPGIQFKLFTNRTSNAKFVKTIPGYGATFPAENDQLKYYCIQQSVPDANCFRISVDQTAPNNLGVSISRIEVDYEYVDFDV